MDDLRLGAILRAVRIRRRLRQADVAAAAGVASMTISRLERGHVDMTSVRVLREVASQLEVRIFFKASWRGGDLDRLVNAGHSAMHEAVAELFDRYTGWQLAPEVSFSIYGERGIVDLLGFHAESGTGLVIELKTEIVDVQELVGTLDRKRRLGRTICAERGWVVADVGMWALIADSRSNRARFAAHRRFIRQAFPGDGHGIGRWLRQPAGPVAALSFLNNEHERIVGRGFGLPKRVYRPRSR